MKRFLLFIIFLFFTHYISAQNVPIGQWQEYLSYSSGVSVTEGNGKVYCATKSGIFVFNNADNSMEHLSKVNGLADIEATVLCFNNYNKKLLIAYKNSNIDIIDNTTIINLADINRKPIIGNKSINNIYFINQYAYIACGFGIVVIDMDKYEVKDTYYIGTNGNALNVRDITSDSTYLYAATDSGIYRASLSSPNLANYNEWNIMSGLPHGIYNTIASANGKIIANYSTFLMNGTKLKDSLFIYNNISWSHFGGSGYVVNSLKTCNRELVIAYDSAVSLFDTNLVLINKYTGYFGDRVRAKQAVLDNSKGLWIADSQYGLVSLKSGGGFEYRYPNGPNSANVASICIEKNNLWVAPGGGGPSGGGGSYYNDGIYTYNGEDWMHIYGNHPPIVNFDTISDIMNVLIDHNNPTKSYATWGNGLIEFDNGLPVKAYNQNNSTLKKYNLTDVNPIWVIGLAIDASDNLWVTNSGVPFCLSEKNPDGIWQSLDFSPLLGNSPNLTQILVDKSDQKWMIQYRDGIIVYNGTNASPTAANTKIMTMTVGQGALPSLDVFCLAEDQDGQIWVGTDQGIAVFYSPSTLFSGQNFDAQQILVEQDGNAQILLLTETVQSIAIDDANRKWIATQKSGVFLMSADGTKEIYHFDESNSPLLSNNVSTISINHKTGEVYFGTLKGIISFRGTATESFDDFTDVYSFPNPVKHAYEGPIAIKGLMINSTVKITDINGALLFETISEGGQAIWNGKNFSGQRVSTGVYMVFCTSEDGAKKIATKILFID